MELVFTKTFIRDYRKLSQTIQEQVDRKLALLLQNMRHPSLRVKKVRGYDDVWEGSITMNYRFFFRQAVDKYVLLRVGTHNELLER